MSKRKRLEQNQPELVAAAKQTKQPAMSAGRPARSLTREEEKRLLEACTDNHVRLKPIILCAIDAGMRRGEILSLKWEDIDFEHSKITVKATKTLEHPQVRMTARLSEELAGLYEAGSAGLVFSIMNVKRSFRSALEAAGVPDLRFYNLRCTWAKRAKEENARGRTAVQSKRR